MLYYNFNGYEGFKERFGMVEHGNGVKSRRNKILLAYVKQPQLLRDARMSGNYSELNISSMTQLWNVLSDKIYRAHYDVRVPERFYLLGIALGSKSYRLDELDGVCEDGDIRAIRYVNLENNRVFKMKAGRFFNKCLEDMGITWPEPVRLWMCEEFQRQWETYSSQNRVSKTGELDLQVDDDFKSIYSYRACAGDFYSCMMDDGQWPFYREAVNAKAAYLRRKADGKIVARCVIFNEVHDTDTGEVLRLAERQYATECDDVLKRLLVDALIKGDYIDGYKKVGVDCHNNRAYIGKNGEDWSDRKFWIDCHLEAGDTLSYQDSFIFYNEDEYRAYNYAADGAMECLNETSSEYEGRGEWDSYNRRWTREELYEVYWNGRMYETDYYTRQDDFHEINGEWYHDDDCVRCPHCGAYMLSDNEDNYSELTDEYYCSDYCREREEEDYKANHWTWAEYDEEYFEDSDDVVNFRNFYGEQGGNGFYYDQTISIKSLQRLIDREEVILCNGTWHAIPYTRDYGYVIYKRTGSVRLGVVYNYND